MSAITEVRHSPSQPISVRRGILFVQHAPSSAEILALWTGNKVDQRRVIVNKAVKHIVDEDYQVLPEDRYIGGDTTGGDPITFTLPDVSDINDGHIVTIKDEGGAATTDNIVIATPGAETSDVAAIAANDDCVHLMWDLENTNWMLINGQVT